MKKKQKPEPIILNQTELTPTTIGSVGGKEKGPLGVILLILLFVICIIVLPYIDTILHLQDNNVPTPPVIKDPNEEEPDEPNEPEITYYPLSANLIIKSNGFSFTKFMIDQSSKLLSWTIKNESGTSSYFKNHNYYLELYSNQNKLLQRIKIANQEITTFIDSSFDITEALNNGTISKVALREIQKEDYPNISLKTNSDELGFLTCQKENQKLIYYFTNQENNYLLKSIEEQKSFLNTELNYNETLTNYTTLMNSLSNIAGVKSNLIPTTKGFNYTVTIDVSTINTNSFNRYFKEPYYYKKETLAKVIAFELVTLGFSCS